MVTKKQQELENDSWQLVLFYLPVVVALLAFSLFHYGRLTKQYAAGPNIKRVTDPGKFLESAGMSAIIGALLCTLLWAAYQASFLLVLPILPVAFYFANLLGKIQARVFLGVVIDYDNGIVIFEPDISHWSIIDYLKVVPYLKSFTELEQVKLVQIKKITREAGKHLYIHGDFGSRRISFTNKQKRDECIHFLTAAEDSEVKLATEFE